MISVEQLVANSREWVGTKFVHQGRSRFGCDCLGLIAADLAELGSRVLLNHLPKNYGRNPQSLLIDGLTNLCRTIDLEPGALVLFQFPKAEFPSHAAIYTGESIIHAFQSEGKVVETSLGAPWTRLAHSNWALPLVVYR